MELSHSPLLSSVFFSQLPHSLSLSTSCTSFPLSPHSVPLPISLPLISFFTSVSPLPLSHSFSLTFSLSPPTSLSISPPLSLSSSSLYCSSSTHISPSLSLSISFLFLFMSFPLLSPSTPLFLIPLFMLISMEQMLMNPSKGLRWLPSKIKENILGSGIRWSPSIAAEKENISVLSPYQFLLRSAPIFRRTTDRQLGCYTWLHN